MARLYIKPFEEQKYIKHIIKILGNNNMKRSKLFSSVQKKEEKLHNKRPFYQTINRDIQ